MSKPEEESGKQGRGSMDSVHLAMGEVVMLLGESKGHRHMFLSDLMWQVLPALLLRQYKLIRDKNDNTMGYLSWANATDDVVQRMMQGREYRLRPSEWKGGDKAVMVQLECPPGTEGKVLGSVKASEFADRGFFVIVTNAEGKAQLKEVKMPEPGNDPALAKEKEEAQ